MVQHFFVRLQPPRPTFAMDMTDAERSLMGEHAAYMKQFFVSGKLLAYGPVLDPEGSFGMAILAVESEDEVKAFIANDPTVLCGMNGCSYAPMFLGGAQAPRNSDALAHS